MWPGVSAREHIIPSPPRRYRTNGRWCGNTQPRGTGGGRMTGLARGIKALFDRLLIFRVAPCAEKIADGINMQHLLQGQCNLRAHYFIQRQAQDWIFVHITPFIPREVHRWSAEAVRAANAKTVHRRSIRIAGILLWKGARLCSTALSPAAPNRFCRNLKAPDSLRPFVRFQSEDMVTPIPLSSNPMGSP